MALTLFSSYDDNESVKRFLIEKGFEIRGNERRWDAICSSTTGILFMKKIRSLQFSFDADWCSGSSWATQIEGMQNYMARFPMGPALRSRVREMIGSFNLALGIEAVPDIESTNDLRVDIAGEICRLVDGVFFTPVSLLDAQFRTIIDVDGVTDPAAKLPALAPAVRKRSEVSVPTAEPAMAHGSSMPLAPVLPIDAGAAPAPHPFDVEIDSDSNETPGSELESIEEVQDLGNITHHDFTSDIRRETKEDEATGDLNDHPSAGRVVKRMYCLASVAARGLLEMSASEGKPFAYTNRDLINWISRLDIVDEFEPDELELLRTPVGSVPEEWVINSVWRLEGVAVLAWALGLAPLPAYDDLADTDRLLEAIGFMGDADKVNWLVKNASLTSPNSLKIYNDQVFAFHWRMVDFEMRPEPMDFRKMEQECWFGPLNLTWASFSDDNDLAIRGRAISEAHPNLVSSIRSIASERHIASNWLMGQNGVYSAIDAST